VSLDNIYNTRNFDLKNKPMFNMMAKVKNGIDAKFNKKISWRK
jgi:hypothetical protein